MQRHSFAIVRAVHVLKMLLPVKTNIALKMKDKYCWTSADLVGSRKARQFGDRFAADARGEAGGGSGRGARRAHWCRHRLRRRGAGLLAGCRALPLVVLLQQQRWSRDITVNYNCISTLHIHSLKHHGMRNTCTYMYCICTYAKILLKLDELTTKLSSNRQQRIVDAEVVI